SKKKGYTGKPFAGVPNIGKAFISAIWGLLMPAIILGGIYGGIFTPTEAAVVAVVYGLLIGFFVYKDLKIAHLPKIIESSIVGTAVVMFIMNAAGLFSWIITREQIPVHLANYFVSISRNPTMFLMLVNVMLLIAGMFLNASAAVTILAPILVPLAKTLGIDPIFFGVLMTCNLAIGCLTPPVGVDLFVSSTISGVSMAKLSKGIVPFIIVLIADLIVITYVPGIIMWLPNLVK
ncbi:MAG: TRAP transporter large permease, partial [Treponemataceae bacterium]